MTRSARVKVMIFLALMVSLPWLLVQSLLRTDTGSQWLLGWAAETAGTTLGYRSASGSWAEGLNISELRFESGALEADIQRVQVQASFSLIPISIQVSSLSVDGLRVEEFEPEDNGQPIGEHFLAQLQLPIPLQIEHVAVDSINWYRPGSAQPLVASEIRFWLGWHETLEIRDFLLRAQERIFSGNFQLELNQTGLHLAELRMTGVSQNDSQDVVLGLEGDLQNTRLSLESATPAFQVEGEVLQLISDPQWSINWQLDGPVPAIANWQLESLSGQLEGSLNDFQVSANGQIQMPGAEPLPLRLLWAGSISDEQFLVSGGSGIDLAGIRLGIEGQGTLAASLSLSGMLELEPFTPAEQPLPGQLGWHSDQSLSGTLPFKLVGTSLALSDVQLLVGQTGQIKGSADLDWGTEVARVDFTWLNIDQGLFIPGESSEALLRSPRGQLSVEGGFGNWSLDSQMSIGAGQYPEGELNLSGQGSQSQLKLEAIELEALGGLASGDALLRWPAELSLETEMSLSNIDLSVLDARWPEQLSGQFRLAYGESWVVRLARPEGLWRDQAFTSTGWVEASPGQLNAGRFKAESGDSHVLLDGDLYSAQGVGFEVDLRGASWLNGPAGGTLAGAGKIFTENGLMQLDGALEGQNLRLGDWQATAVSASGGRNQLKLELTGLSSQDMALEALSLALDNSGAQASLQAGLVHPNWRLDGLIDGESWWPQYPMSLPWSGQLRSLMVSGIEGGNVRLTRPAPVSLSDSGFNINDACLDAESGGSLCLQTFGLASDRIAVQGEFSQFSLALATLWVGGAVQLDQQLSGPFELTRTSDALPSGHADLQISAGRITDRVSGQSLETNEGLIGMRLEEGQLRDGRVDLSIPNAGHVLLDLDMDGVAFDGTARLDGRLQLDITDVTYLQTLLPYTSDIRGQLMADLALSGVVNDPTISGQFKVSEAGFAIPILGITAWGLKLEGDLSGQDRIVMDGSLRLGEGIAELSLDGDYSSQWPPKFRLGVRGTDLELLDLPDLYARGDMDLQLGWQQAQWSISGQALLHDTRIAPAASFTVPARESEDLVIINQDSEVPESNGAVGKAQVFGQLQLDIGQQVELVSDLANASMTGSLMLDWNGALEPNATGSIRVDGVVSAYGPRLQLTDSTLRFPGDPVSEPVLDLKAERDIFGNTQVRAAGVRIGGVPTSPEIEAYTVPYTNQDRAWALLITGSDLEYGQGIGGFDIGTYIAPRLYLSYEVSLLDSDNVVGVRYDLRKGFGVKATSGQRDSGIDATYTRDY